METLILLHMLEKINNMKIILVISILFSGCSQNNHESYLKKFKDIELPLNINRANIFDFNNMIFNETTETHVKNVYPVLDSTYYNYINLKENNNEVIINYRCIYKFNLDNFNQAVIVSEDHIVDGEEQAIWFRLYTYNSEGAIIDNLLIGGYKIDYKEQFFILDKNRNIRTTMFEFLPPPDNDYDNIYAKRISNKYKISDSGKIIQQEEEREKEAKFSITHDGYKELVK